MNEELLTAARQAEERLIEAEHDAEVARAEFHRAVRRLHLSGASLRELAAALHLSHQRVHQIVEAAGGARSWARHRPPPDLACSFCGRPAPKTRSLVAGPSVYICDKCVDLADAVLTSGQAAETALGPLRPVPEDASRPRCSFCGKHRRQVTGLATTIDNPVGKAGGKAGGDAAICTECLALCREIHAEQLT